MRGTDARSGSLFSCIDLEARVPANHPLRVIKALVDEVLVSLDSEFAGLHCGLKPAVDPTLTLERASLLMTSAPR